MDKEGRFMVPQEPFFQDSGEDQNRSSSENTETSLVSEDIIDILHERLSKAFYANSPQQIVHEITKIALDFDPIDLAYAVAILPLPGRVLVYQSLPDLEDKVAFAIHTSRNTRVAVFRHIPDEEIKALFYRMPSDEAAFFLDELPDRRSKRILEEMEPQKAQKIRDLRSHGRFSAGGMMTNEFFSFSYQETISEVTALIRNNPDIPLTQRVFVLNEEKELIGYVSDRALIISPPHLKLKQVLSPVLQTVTVDIPREEVVDLFERYSLTVLPVIDEENHLLGVISFEDAVEAMKDIADDLIANIAGTSENIDEDEPGWKRVIWRAPWLIVTLCAGLTTATIMSSMRDYPWFHTVPFFVPLIAGMSGNVGIQTSTLLVRAMSTGELNLGSRRMVVFRELSTGLLIGLFFGLISALATISLNFLGFNLLPIDPLMTAIMVSGGLFGACLMSSCLGAISPILFDILDIDPAVASGPIVAAMNDILSTLLLIGVSYFIFSFFVF